MLGDDTKRIVRAVQELSMARDIGRVMEIVRTEARALAGADGAAFVLKDKDMCYYADEDAISPLWKGSRFPMKACISGWAMMNKQSVVIKDIYQDDRIPHDAYRPTFVRSLAMVPIRTPAPIGAIGTYWASEHVPSGEQLELLQSLADVTSVTIDNIGLYADLEARVKDRTAELDLANAKLELANKELEAFSYSVSHDLRAPLRSVIAYARILQEETSGLLTESAEKALGTLHANARRMGFLIDDLLRFSRVGQEQLKKSEIDFQELVSEVMNSMQPSIPQKSEIKVHPLPAAVADYRLISQVWANLIGNAIKYSSKKENPMIEIGCDHSDGEIVFYVKDNGAGFDMKYADKLFAVFQRLHLPEDFEGTGVGLALSKRIVVRHGGRIWAESRVDDGATFYFSLPTVGSS